ncbi:MAG: hypothetical protein K5880_18905 [Hydrogenophaga sp.]|uniref:hypothetical protein n=1 Tax=Hydrogenophaga sp. TaxID=1904254 RepID=UPI002620B5CC|nr:hypothetical protein [Hydrogenophaga sp.]MCV0440667.1 hypothetical protein [Hydrogenophaga sp.]
MSFRIVSHLLPICLGCASLPVWAQNTLTVPMEVVHVSNPNLVPDGLGDDSRRGSATLYRLHPQYTLQFADEATRTELSLGGLIERSSNTALSAHRSLPSLGVLWESRRPTSLIGLRASLAEASTRETEFAEFGRVATDSTQRTGSIGATWATELTSNTGVELAAFHSRVNYDTSAARDYQETGGSASYRRQIDENNRYSLTVSTARQQQESDRSGGVARNRVSRTGLIFGFESNLSERQTLVANVGVVRAGSFDKETHSIGGVRLAGEGERLTYSLEWSVDVSADGTSRGYTRASTVGLSLGYSLTAQTSFTAGGSRARALSGERSEGFLLYAQIRSELSPFWAVTAGLEHRRARTADAPFARGHTVTLGLVYTHPDF